ncbi:MAG: holin [Eubacteriales bacterium]
MTSLISKTWWMAAGTRAIKTVAQTAVATIGVAAAMGEVNWVYLGSAALLAGVMSLLTSLAGIPEVTTETIVE